MRQTHAYVGTFSESLDMEGILAMVVLVFEAILVLQVILISEECRIGLRVEPSKLYTLYGQGGVAGATAN